MDPPAGPVACAWPGRRNLLKIYRGAGVAQLVERDLAKVEVVGSRPITRSTLFFGVLKAAL